jgi:hypothetical protein
VTDAGVRAFHKLLPNCRIEYIEPNSNPSPGKLNNNPKTKGKIPPD